MTDDSRRDAVLRQQEALARVLTDARLRDTVFAAESESVDHEDGWLRALPRNRIEAFAHLLVLNRLTKAIEGLPLTTHILGNGLWRVTLEYAQAVPPRVAKKHAEALAFARYLRERFDSLTAASPLLDDALLYETAALEVQFAPDDDASATAARPGVPRPNPHLRVIPIRFDLESLGAAVERGSATRTAPYRPMLVLLHRSATGGLGQAEITMPTAAFISACDGETPLPGVVARVAAGLGQDAGDPVFRRKCADICTALEEQGIITMSRAALRADG